LAFETIALRLYFFNAPAHLGFGCGISFGWGPGDGADDALIQAFSFRGNILILPHQLCELIGARCKSRRKRRNCLSCCR
jgi:hypothetical protein